MSSLPGLNAALAELYGHVGQYEAQPAQAERAVESVSIAKDAHHLAEANVARGCALTYLLRSEEALQVLKETAQQAQRIGDLPVLFEAYQFMIGVGNVTGRPADALEAGDRAVEVAERLSDPELISLAYSSRSLASGDLGEWDKAAGDIDRALTRGRQIGAGDATAFALLRHGELCVQSGDVAEATRALEECLEMVERSGNLFHLRRVGTALAQRDMLLGHPKKACARLISLIEESSEEENLTITENVRPTLILAYIDAGELDSAKELLDLHKARVERVAHLPAMMGSLHLQAMLATHLAQWEEARIALEKGLTLARRIPIPQAEAFLLTTYGEMHRERGEVELARERLEAALKIFRHLGARPDIERVNRMLNVLTSQGTA